MASICVRAFKPLARNLARPAGSLISVSGRKALSSGAVASPLRAARYRRGVIATLAFATTVAAGARQFHTTSLSLMAAHCHGAEGMEGGGGVAGAEAKETFRKDYKPSDYLVPEINMMFDLGASKTVLTTTSTVVPSNAGADLVLDGEDCIKLVSLEVDGKAITEDQYKIEKDTLRIQGSALPAAQFNLVSKVELNPKENLALSGLYASGEKLLCTQCEAEGFRRITYHLDRPDILSKYTVRLEADKKYPQLLSNGNMIDSGDLGGGRHFTVWNDPFPKPSYLFALVGGDLGSVQDTYTTKSGKVVNIGIYSEKEDAHKLDHAMYSIKESMKWDEDKFGLECDLDVYNIVATSDFNMGAMENKGLNIFNSAYVLANGATATDVDFENVLGVIGHEYFHNWTGNRVTLRDWFQLTLKEGLTVFRDQWFSSDMTGEAVKRIGDVRGLRGRQFQEDSGPMSHPIRPESYVAMDNFYTATVYSKVRYLFTPLYLSCE
jgi:aminopeptidase N